MKHFTGPEKQNRASELVMSVKPTEAQEKARKYDELLPLLEKQIALVKERAEAEDETLRAVVYLQIVEITNRIQKILEKK